MSKRKNQTPAELAAWEELARAARKLREAQEEAYRAKRKVIEPPLLSTQIKKELDEFIAMSNSVHEAYKSLRRLWVLAKRFERKQEKLRKANAIPTEKPQAGADAS